VWDRPWLGIGLLAKKIGSDSYSHSCRIDAACIRLDKYDLLKKMCAYFAIELILVVSKEILCEKNWSSLYLQKGLITILKLKDEKIYVIVVLREPTWKRKDGLA
jgi:hypothetical protein